MANGSLKINFHRINSERKYFIFLNASSQVFCQCLRLIHCVKRVQTRSFFWSLFSRIRTKYGEILRFWTLHAVILSCDNEILSYVVVLISHIYSLQYFKETLQVKVIYYESSFREASFIEQVKEISKKILMQCRGIPICLKPSRALPSLLSLKLSQALQRRHFAKHL